MIPSKAKKTISLAISLLVVVISLTGVALGAVAPVAPFTVQKYEQAGFAGAPGKMARDTAGNFYVTDFWGKGIVKLNRNGGKIGFIPTLGRPSAVTVLADNRLVVAMAAPRPYVAFYSQTVSAPVSGEQLSEFTGTPTVPLYRPVAITVDSAGKIYVLDAGDNSGDKNGFGQIVVPASIYRGNVKVYSAAGSWLHEFGERTYPIEVFTGTNPGYFKSPQGIAYEKASNQIVVVDTQNHRLQYFTASNGSACNHVRSVGTIAGVNTGDPVITAVVKYYNPVDVAFEYNDLAVLQRIYVAEKGKNQISVVNAVNDYFLSSLNSTTTVSGAAMKFPSAVLFERTATGSSTAGVLYIANDATASAANIMALGLDGGTVPPAATVAMAFNPPVPAVSPSTPINVSGTTVPGTPVTCTVNGVAFAATGTGSWTVNGVALQAGMNYIRCSSITGGASVEASTFYGSEMTEPTVAITQPAGTIYTGNASVTISGTTTPGNATVTLTNSLVGGTETTQSDATGNWSKVVTLTVEGINRITATAQKQGTAVSASVFRDVVYDISDPIMTNATISFIAGGATTTNAVQNLDGIVKEANLQSITVNGVPVAATAQVSLAGNNTYFSIPVTLNRGANTLTVIATDKLNRKTTISRSVTLAPEKPGFIAVNLPADNKFRPSAAPESASGTVDPSFTSVVACGSASVTPVAGTGNWSTTTANLVAGFVSCQLTASGGSNTPVNEKRTFNTSGNYNTTNITHTLVAITSPASDLATKTAAMPLSGSVAVGAATPQITINGVTTAVTPVGTYNSTTGAFTYPVTLQQGLNTIKITATATSITSSAVRNIIYDTAPPELSIQADSKSMPTFIYGSLEPSAKISSINASIGTPATPVIIPVSDTTMKFDTYDQSGAVTWKADLTGYAYDKISFTVLDPALNASTLFYANGIPTGDIDRDGTVRLADALAALRHVAGTEVINPEVDNTKFFHGDVGGLVKGRVARDGIIDITDSVLILNKAYGLMAF